MLVRASEGRDAGAIAALTNRYIVGHHTHFAYEPVTAEEIAGQIAGAGRYPWLTAEIGGEVAGYAKAGVWRARTAYSWTAETAIYVRPEHQGRGLGRRLYSALLEELRGRGFHSAIGGIALPNAASVALHESVGFRHVGTFRHAGYKLGRWVDAGFWQVVLREEGHAPEGASTMGGA